MFNKGISPNEVAPLVSLLLFISWSFEMRECIVIERQWSLQRCQYRSLAFQRSRVFSTEFNLTSPCSNRMPISTLVRQFTLYLDLTTPNGPISLVELSLPLSFFLSLFLSLSLSFSLISSLVGWSASIRFDRSPPGATSCSIESSNQFVLTICHFYS